MILYSVYDGSGDGSEWFTSERAAIKRAREIHRHAPGGTVWVSREKITLKGRALLLAVLNDGGFVADSQEILVLGESRPTGGA